MGINFMTGFEIDVPVGGYYESGWEVFVASTLGGVNNTAFWGQIETDTPDSHQPTGVAYGGGGRCCKMVPETMFYYCMLKTPVDAMDHAAGVGTGLAEYIVSLSYKPIQAHQTGGNRILAVAWDNSAAGAAAPIFEITQNGTVTGTTFNAGIKLQTGESGGSPTFTTAVTASKCFDLSGGGQWAFVQIVVKQHDVNGVFKLYVNGVLEYDYSGPFGCLISGAVQKTERIALNQQGSSAAFDHLVIYGGLSSITDSLWEKHIQGLMPAANDAMGSFVRAGSSSGSPIGPAWTDVNGHPTVNPESFDAAKYVESSVGATPATDAVTVECQNRSIVHASFAPTDIPAVNVVQMVYGQENGPRGHNKISGNGVAFTDGTAFDISYNQGGGTLGHLIWQCWEDNPQTANAWTGSDLDVLKIGFKKS